MTTIQELQEETLKKYNEIVVPIISNALDEYNHTEGHEEPEICTNDDLNVIFNFIKKAQVEAYNLGIQTAIDALPENYTGMYRSTSNRIKAENREEYREESITNINNKRI